MRSNLEVFLLALVQGDVHTPYEMMTKVDISLGSSLPALNRLEKQGLVRVSEGPSRGRKVFTLTTRGSMSLRKEWESVMGTTGDDLDSILRAAALLWARKGKKRGGKFLREKGASLKKKLKQCPLPKGSAEELTVRGGLKERYLWLRRTVELAGREAEIAAIFALSRQLSPEEDRERK